jgi:hypothetical protein
MNVTRDDAAKALGEIDKATSKVIELKGYHQGAPHFIVWGVVWLIANSITQFYPQFAGTAWLSLIGVGMVASTVIGFLQARGQKPGAAASNPPGMGWKMGATSGVVFVFIFCMILIARPETSRQSNAMISIIFPFLYMCGGIWAGWRLFAIGLVTAAGILFGFFYVKEWFDLWMAVFAGGALIAAGLWLRSA